MNINNRYEILTPDGWKDFRGVMEKGVQKTYELTLMDGTAIQATEKHKFCGLNGKVPLCELSIGDMIQTTKGFEEIVSINYHSEQIVYDIVEVIDSDHKFIVQSKIITQNCDEFAFLPNGIARDFWVAIQPVLATGGGCIITSTPKSDEDQFAQIWKGANQTTDDYGNDIPGGVGINGFFPIKVTWDKHPERDEAWAAPFRASLGPAKFAQEFCCISASTPLQLIDVNNQMVNLSIGDLFNKLKSEQKDE